MTRFGITANALQTFVMVVQAGSFIAAGERLFRTPNAVNVAITRMEKDLGVKLFRRITHRTIAKDRIERYELELTTRGKVLYDMVLEPLGKIQIALEIVAGKGEAARQPEAGVPTVRSAKSFQQTYNF